MAPTQDEELNVEKKQQPKTEVEEKWEYFVEATKSLTKEQKVELNQFWETTSGGKPKPKKETATIEDLQSLITEVLRIKFGGVYVSEPSKE